MKKYIDLIKPDFRHGPWVAGGAAIKAYKKEHLGESDIDIFVRDDEQLNRVFRTLMSYDFIKVCHTENAITLKLLSNTSTNHDVSVQIIKKHYSNLQTVFDSFDFRVCKIAYDGKDFRYEKDTIEHIKKKILDVDIVRDSFLKRFGKYYSYGYTPTKKTYEALLNPTLKTNFVNDADYDDI